MPLDLLELTQSTSERDLKRTYARLLKVHRPDEDPAAFQRLRQAYEHTLSELRYAASLEGEAEVSRAPAAPASLLTEVPASARVEPSAPPVIPVVPATSDLPTESIVPVVPIEPAAPALPVAPIPRLVDGWISEDPRRVEVLLEGDLDQGWKEARREGLEHDFQLGLLQLCLAGASLDKLDWARATLAWLTPAQPEYLGPAEVAFLAGKLAARVLEQVRQALERDRETKAYRLLRAALADDWLQPLDRRSRFQAQVFDLLESDGHWTPAFFDRICALSGWSDERGHLPSSAERWAAIMHRCHAYALEASLREQLAAPAKTPVQRAVWFLFADLSDGQRRRWADEFTAEDWQACEDLAYDVADHPQLSTALQRPYLADWRAWKPHGYWGWGYFYVWVMLSLALCISLLDDPRKIIDEGLSTLLLGPLFLVPLLLTVAYWLMRIWTDLTRLLAGPDVALSAWLLPKSLTRNGSGVLVLRHIFPSFIPAGLVYLWSRALPTLGLVLTLITVLGAVNFANTITRGDSPACWFESFLYRLVHHRHEVERGLHLAISVIIMSVLAVLWLKFG